MRKLILASVSVLALGIAGSGLGYAAEPSNNANNMPGASSTNMPSTSTQNPSAAAMPQNGQTETAPVNVSESQVKQVQQQLKSAGLYKGTVDGRMGAETKQAISQFQQQNGLDQTGTLDQQTLAAMNNQNNAGSSMSGSGSQAPATGAGSRLNQSSAPTSR